MADATPNLMEQVRDYLTQVFKGAAGAASSSAPAASQAAVLAFEPIGMPVSPADFRLNQSDAASPMLASVGLQRTSQYSDWVPAVDANGDLQITTLTVSGQYGIVIGESQATSASNVDGFSAVKAPAKRQFDAALTPGLDTSGAGSEVQFYATFPTPPDWYDTSNQANWSSATFGSPAAQPPADSTPTPTPAPTPPVDVGLRWRVPPVPFRPTGFHPTLLGQPSHMMFAAASVSARSPLFARSMEFEDRPAMMREPLISTQVSAPPVLVAEPVTPAASWHALVAVNQTATPQPTQSDGLSISFDYCLVRLSRPWVSFDFLSSPDWYVPGMAAGALSNGNDLSGAFRFSAVPVAFVAVKAVKITANWSDADKGAAQSAVSLGQFALLDANFDGATLNIPGMQILAWVCEPTPQLPPASDPSLPPPPVSA